MAERDIFENHVATYEKHNEHLETLRWKEPNCSTYAIYYVRQYGVLMVFGDCYEATYMWSWSDPRIDLRWIAGCNQDYFLSKCRASPHGRDPKVFDSHFLEEEMKDYFAREREQWCDCQEDGECDCEGDCDCAEESYKCEDCINREEAEQKFKEDGGWGAMEGEHEWVEWLRTYADDIFGVDWWEGMPDGKRYDTCVLLHLEGLKRAVAYLDEQEKENNV